MAARCADFEFGAILGQAGCWSAGRTSRLGLPPIAQLDHGPGAVAELDPRSEPSFSELLRGVGTDCERQNGVPFQELLQLDRGRFAAGGSRDALECALDQPAVHLAFEHAALQRDGVHERAGRMREQADVLEAEPARRIVIERQQNRSALAAEHVGEEAPAWQLALHGAGLAHLNANSVGPVGVADRADWAVRYLPVLRVKLGRDENCRAGHAADELPPGQWKNVLSRDVGRARPVLIAPHSFPQSRHRARRTVQGAAADDQPRRSFPGAPSSFRCVLPDLRCLLARPSLTIVLESAPTGGTASKLRRESVPSRRAFDLDFWGDADGDIRMHPYHRTQRRLRWFCARALGPPKSILGCAVAH
jgi:hypothetical protein